MSEPTNPNQPNQQQVQIKADEKELLGQYANLAIIHHNGEEFTLNFIYFRACHRESWCRALSLVQGTPSACWPR